MLNIRRLILVSLMFTLILASLPAQESSTLHLDVGVGAGVPLGDFGDEEEGAAELGYMGSLIIRSEIQEGFGFFGAYVLNINPVDVDSVADAFSSIDPSLDWSLSSNSWMAHSLLGGPAFSHRSGSVEVEATVGIGLTIGRSPEFDVEATDGFSTVTVSQESAFATALGIYAGAKARYWFRESVAAYLGFTYLYSEPEFEDVRLELRENGVLLDSSEGSFEQVYSIVSIPVGVTVQL